ncbi:MAG: hypothetical protein AAF909_01630 [Pseudomonadota bacterium]
MKTVEFRNMNPVGGAAPRLALVLALLLATSLVLSNDASAQVDAGFAAAADFEADPGFEDSGFEDDGVAFDALPNSALLELYTEVGVVLKRRGLMRPDWDPAQDYAMYLAGKTLDLQASSDGAALGDGRAQGPGGVRFLVRGVRMGEPSESPPLDTGAPGEFDRLAVLMFLPDYTVHRAVVLPQDALAGRSNPLALTEAVLSAPGVEDITNRVYRFVGDGFE